MPDRLERELVFEGITAAEAARRLRVKRKTIYAYVSRGMLSSRRVPGERESRFDPAEVERLAARRRPERGRAADIELIVDSGLTFLDPAGKLSYRGWDAVQASRTALFEHVAMWLWGRHPHFLEDAMEVFSAPDALVDRARQAGSLAGPDAPPLDRYVLALGALSAADTFRHGRDPYGVSNRSARLLTALVDSLPVVSRRKPRRGWHPIAERLWYRLAPAPPTSNEVRVLNSALVLLADHEMATSTLAARVAASTWSDIYRVVLAGMATLGGALHGGAGDAAARLLRDAMASAPSHAIAERMRAGQEPPGFGHLVYLQRDPRAVALLEEVNAAWPGHPAVAVADEVVRTVQLERPETFPNVDLALGTLVAAADMVDGAGEAIFATARIAGWVAHGIEEYQHRLRFRTRATYTGPPPGSSGGPPLSPIEF